MGISVHDHDRRARYSVTIGVMRRVSNICKALGRYNFFDVLKIYCEHYMAAGGSEKS